MLYSTQGWLAVIAEIRIIVAVKGSGSNVPRPPDAWEFHGLLEWSKAKNLVALLRR